MKQKRKNTRIVRRRRRNQLLQPLTKRKHSQTRFPRYPIPIFFYFLYFILSPPHSLSSSAPNVWMKMNTVSIASNALQVQELARHGISLTKHQKASRPKEGTRNSNNQEIAVITEGAKWKQQWSFTHMKRQTQQSMAHLTCRTFRMWWSPNSLGIAEAPLQKFVYR